MSCFNDALCNCTQEEENEALDGFSEPDLWRYLNAPMASTMAGDLVSTTDFEYENKGKGVWTRQVSSPLIPEPLYPSATPSTLYFWQTEEQSQKQPEQQKKDKSGELSHNQEQSGEAFHTHDKQKSSDKSQNNSLQPFQSFSAPLKNAHSDRQGQAWK